MKYRLLIVNHNNFGLDAISFYLEKKKRIEGDWEHILSDMFSTPKQEDVYKYIKFISECLEKPETALLHMKDSDILKKGLAEKRVKKLGNKKIEFHTHLV